MKMTAVLAAVASTLFLVLPVAAWATVYWTPAHELAPQGHAGRVACEDLDGDGDTDVSLVGCYPVAHYWNVGCVSEPTWLLDESQFGEIVVCNSRAGDFGDLDDDGAPDLAIICWYDEFVRFYWNLGPAQAPQWLEDLSVFDGVPKSGGDGQPRLADMDGDGDMDLMLGSWSGRVRYASNVGTPSSPMYEYVGWVEDIPLAAGANPTIALGDLDLDGDLDLVRVTEDTSPECFENVGTAVEFAFAPNPSMLAGVSLPPNEGAYGIDVFDVDADGDLDMLVIAGSDGANLLFLNEGTTPVQRTSWGVIKAMYR